MRFLFYCKTIKSRLASQRQNKSKILKKSSVYKNSQGRRVKTYFTDLLKRNLIKVTASQ